MKSGIYTITNTVTDKIYVGQAVDIIDRWLAHKQELRKNYHHNQHLQKAWNRYGEDKFLFEVLVECEEQFLYSEENYWCNLLQVHDSRYGYNIKPTDPKGNPKHAEETKEKIRKSAIGNKRNVGRIASQQRVEKIRKTKQEAMGKPIVIIKADTGEYICEKNSIGEVCAFLGIPRSRTGNIKLTLLGNCKSYKGYTYVYKKDYNPSINYKRIDTRYKENTAYRKTEMKCNKGTNNPRAKFTEEDVRNIRKMYKEGVKPKRLKELYPFVNIGAIEQIIYNRSWKHLL